MSSQRKDWKTASDEELVQGVRDGDIAAARAFYDRFWGIAYFKARRLFTGMSTDETADAASSVMRRVFKKRDLYRGASSFRKFFDPLAHNEIINHMKKVTRKKRCPKVMMYIDDPGVTLEMPDETPGPARTAEKKDLYERALEEMGRLPDKFRLPLEMRWQKEMTYKEIGKALGIDPRTARDRIKAARKELYRRLGIEENDV